MMRACISSNVLQIKEVSRRQFAEIFGSLLSAVAS